MRSGPGRLLPFSWYGGKFSHLKWLLPIIDNTQHDLYVESFGGSAAILLNKRPSPVEVYNDRHSEVVNFFRTLRTQKEELIELLELTPYSREEFVESLGDLNGLSDLERARRFYVRARQVRTGLVTVATKGNWAYIKKDHNKATKALTVSRWLNGISMLADICCRLKDVQIENLDALDVIKRYDTEETLHYIDPPYMMETRNGHGYAHEFSDKEHQNLLDVLLTLKGKVCISSYWNDLYKEALSKWYIKRINKIALSTISGKTPKTREEVLWANFPIDSLP
jgi:DNA adenine methylase